MNYSDPADEAAAGPYDAAAPRPSWRETLLRLWLIRKIKAPPHGNPTAAVLALSLLCLAAWVGIDWWQRQPRPAFYIDGVPLLAWYAIGVLATAGLLRWRATPRPATAAAVVLVLGLVPFPLLLMSVAAYYLTAVWFWSLAVLIATYAISYLWRGLRGITGRPQRTATVLGFAFIIMFIGMSEWVNAIPDCMESP